MLLSILLHAEFSLLSMCMRLPPVSTFHSVLFHDHDKIICKLLDTLARFSFTTSERD